MSTVTLKSLVSLWTTLARTERYSPYTCDADVMSVQRRSGEEGLSYFTKSLPTLGKALEAWFADGEPADSVLTGSLHSPDFLGIAVRAARNGDSQAVDCVRQLTLLFYKLEVPHEQETEAAFLDSFVKTDEELSFRMADSDLLSDARKLVQRVLCNMDPLDIRPCHGSGATSCRTEQWDKWQKLRYYRKLDAVYPYPDYFFFNATHLADQYARLHNAEERFPTARVILVPKDSRGPRVISCEPAELLYIQQGIMRKLYHLLENHKLTRGLLNFTDQTINRELARIGSKTDEWATLDLKDASDRVSLALVRRIFPRNWVRAFEACRSDWTILPDGRQILLHKFAPMGSSCCFPVEAICFWAIASVACRTNRRPRSGVPVYVYGDDIIVQSSNALLVMEALESVGLLVNRNKSYIQGRFRESCGGEYHNGNDVTVVRVRDPLEGSGTLWASNTDLANKFLAKFGLSDGSRILRVIEEFVGRPLPRTSLDLPGTVRLESSVSNDVFYRSRWNKDLQRREYRIPQLVTRVVNRCEPTWCELLRKELVRGFENVPFAGKRRDNVMKVAESTLDPGQYADSRTVQTKWHWAWLG